MNKNNLISTEFSSEEMKKIDDALNEIIEVLEKRRLTSPLRNDVNTET